MYAIFNSVLNFLSDFLKKWPVAVFCTVAFIFTVARLYISIEPLLLVVIIVGILLILLNTFGKTGSFLTIFFICSMLLGIMSGSHGINHNSILSDKFDGEYVRLEGEISSIPTENSFGQYFFFDVDKAYSNSFSYDKNFKIYVKNTSQMPVQYGEELTFNCRIESTDAVSTQLSNYYIAKGAPLIAEDITLLSVNDNNSAHRALISMRKYVIETGDKFFNGDTAALFKALVAGDKTDFSNELTLSLSKSGLSHLACVSGLHITILGMATYTLLKKRNRFVSCVLSLMVVYVFVFITGASPSAMRAAIMFTTYIVSLLVLQENHSFTSLSISALLLSLINPYVVFDTGFILSFLSVLGIEIFAKFFKRIFRFMPLWIGDSIAVTLSAQIATLPVVINLFGYLSIYSVLANVIVSAFFSYVLYACFIFIPTALITGLNSVFDGICTLLLDAVISIAAFFADLPGSAVYVNSFDIPQIICYYTIVLLFVCRKKISSVFMGSVLILCCGVLLIAPNLISRNQTYA